ncbi:MAG: roadblock/LC7 domain-containing protein [Halobacteriota archaeon]|nr:roadblock/LC7 domain-containing protein [Halobacteriota archaeon]
MTSRSGVLDILKDLTSCDKIIGSAVFSRDGVLINEYGVLKSDLLPSITAMMVKCAEKSIKLLKKGDFEYILVKSDDGAVLTKSYPNFILSIMIESENDLSFALEGMKDARKKINEMI